MNMTSIFRFAEYLQRVVVLGDPSLPMLLFRVGLLSFLLAPFITNDGTCVFLTPVMEHIVFHLEKIGKYSKSGIQCFVSCHIIIYSIISFLHRSLVIHRISSHHMACTHIISNTQNITNTHNITKT